MNGWIVTENRFVLTCRVLFQSRQTHIQTCMVGNPRSANGSQNLCQTMTRLIPYFSDKNWIQIVPESWDRAPHHYLRDLISRNCKDREIREIKSHAKFCWFTVSQELRCPALNLTVNSSFGLYWTELLSRNQMKIVRSRWWKRQILTIGLYTNFFDIPLKNMNGASDFFHTIACTTIL